MEDYLLNDHNELLRVALRLMKISLEKSPAKYDELSSIVKSTRDKYVIDSFYPEFMIAGAMYYFFRNRDSGWSKEDWTGQIEFYDCLTYASLDNCPDNLHDYILAKIEHNYHHRYAIYNTALLRRFAQVVIDETDIEKKGDELDLFPIKTSNFLKFFK